MVRVFALTIFVLASSAQAFAHNWRNHYTTELPYRVINVPYDDTLNVRSGPGTRYPIVADIAPGIGGIYIKTCRRHALWCRVRISTQNETITGWVNMHYLGAYAN